MGNRGDENWGMGEVDRRVERDIAYSMEVPAALLPLLPQLLADLDVFSAAPEDVLELMQPCGLPAGARVLDLGCGKGAVAVALAEAGFAVLGVDAFAPFVAAARQQAEARGVSARCRFVEADLREYLDPAAPFDVVVFAGLGTVLGPADETVRQLRRAVRADGYIVLDDAFLRDDAAAVSGYEDYAGGAETRRRLTAAGDEIIREIQFSPEEMQAVNRQQFDAIRRCAEALAQARPEAAARIHAYVERQQHEGALLETALVPTLWLIRVSG